jgi:hypothetical protein
VAPKDRETMPIDPTLLKEYAGEYRLSPEFSIRISVEGSQLIAEMMVKDNNFYSLNLTQSSFSKSWMHK